MGLMVGLQRVGDDMRTVYERGSRYDDCIIFDHVTAMQARRQILFPALQHANGSIARELYEGGAGAPS